MDIIAEMEWPPSEQEEDNKPIINSKKTHYRDGRAEWARGGGPGDGFQAGLWSFLHFFFFFHLIFEKIAQILWSKKILWTTWPHKKKHIDLDMSGRREV